jgi:hypothetical protein
VIVAAAGQVQHHLQRGTAYLPLQSNEWRRKGCWAGCDENVAMWLELIVDVLIKVS